MIAGCSGTHPRDLGIHGRVHLNAPDLLDDAADLKTVVIGWRVFMKSLIRVTSETVPRSPTSLPCASLARTQRQTLTTAAATTAAKTSHRSHRLPPGRR
jgi:hypothetical protein